MSLSQQCAMALSISYTSLHNASLITSQWKTGNHLWQTWVDEDKFWCELANGVSSYDGYEMWEVSNYILVEGEHKDTLFIYVQNSWTEDILFQSL